MAHIGKKGRLQFIRRLCFLFRFHQFAAHQFQLSNVPFDADNDGREVFTFYYDFLFVQNQQIAIFVFTFHDPVHPFSGIGNFHILFPFLLCHFQRIIIEIVHTDGVFRADIPVIRFPVSVDIPEIILYILHNDPRREVFHRGIHDAVEPFYLRFVPYTFRYVVCKRPKGFLSVIRCHAVHRTLKRQCVFIILQRVVGQEVEILSFPYAVVTFFPILRTVHVAYNVENPYLR